MFKSAVYKNPVCVTETTDIKEAESFEHKNQECFFRSSQFLNRFLSALIKLFGENIKSENDFYSRFIK
jgi:hypothetical protein